MKREIKFRVWDIKNQKMITHIEGIMFEDKEPSITLTGRDYIHNSQEWEMLYAGEYELIQFTGVKDKNRKDIWEGDIIKWMYGDYEKPCITEVFYDNSVGRFAIPLTDDGKPIEIEIIGNIYENTESKTSISK